MAASPILFDLRLLPPKDMSIGRTPIALRPPESLNGDGAGVMFSPGRMTITYDSIRLWSRESHLAYNRMRSWSQGGVRAVHVPIITDYFAPTLTENGPVWARSSFSDGGTFSDGGLFAGETIVAFVAEAALLSAGTLKIKVSTGGQLVGGEMFSLFSTELGHHPHDIVQVDNAETVAGGVVYTCWISPGLFFPVAVGDEARFVRPLCTSIIQDGEKLLYETSGSLLSDVRPTMKFIEKLGW
ncbi:hypothetical protein [Pleomorphomonas sp. PLEO]|uniref:hypothetical protein n=1 Tax=Pleomorphomonas sp. PLEO TaxID=3239306 RepID=UPI00351E2122